MKAKNFERSESIRRELLGTSDQLCSKTDANALGLTLRNFLPTLDREFVLEWLPEQAEDIFWVLTSRTMIVKVEIRRGQSGDEETASLQAVDVAEFRRKPHSREVTEKLEIALELMSG